MEWITLIFTIYEMFRIRWVHSKCRPFFMFCWNYCKFNMPDGTLTINIIILFMEENLLIKRYNIKVSAYFRWCRKKESLMTFSYFDFINLCYLPNKTSECDLKQSLTHSAQFSLHIVKNIVDFYSLLGFHLFIYFNKIFRKDHLICFRMAFCLLLVPIAHKFDYME